MIQNSNQESQLLDILKRKGLISGISAKSLLGFMDKWSIDAYRAVVETHCIEESRLADVLADEFKLSRLARLRSRPVDKDTLKFLTYKDAMSFFVLPFSFDVDDNLQVAIADPTKRTCIENWVANSTKKIVFHVAERSEIEASIQKHYPLSMQLPVTMTSYLQDTSG